MKFGLEAFDGHLWLLRTMYTRRELLILISPPVASLALLFVGVFHSQHDVARSVLMVMTLTLIVVDFYLMLTTAAARLYYRALESIADDWDGCQALGEEGPTEHRTCREANLPFAEGCTYCRVTAVLGK